jgi:ankyrin repeat protein
MKVMLAQGDYTKDEINYAFEGSCMIDQKDMVEYLLGFCDEHDLKVDSRKYLMIAFMAESFSTARLLLDRICDSVDMTSSTEAQLFLIYAAGCGKIDLLTRLLNEGNCKVNAAIQQHYGENTRTYGPLSQASDPAVIKVLLEAKANVNPKRGDCALRGACTMLRPDAVKMLIDAGANANDVNFGRTSLIYALEAKCTAEQADDLTKVVKLLLEAGVDTFGNIAPLQLCTNPNQPYQKEAMKALLKHDPCMADDVDSSGLTALMCATMSHTRSPSALSVLTDAGVRLDDVGDQGKPALFFAFKYVDEVWKGIRRPRYMRECLQLLLRAGADPTVTDKRGWTLLMDLIGFQDPCRMYPYIVDDHVSRILISDILDAIVNSPIDLAENIRKRAAEDALVMDQSDEEYSDDDDGEDDMFSMLQQLMMNFQQ